MPESASDSNTLQIPIDSIVAGTPAEGSEIHQIEWTACGSLEIEYTPEN